MHTVKPKFMFGFSFSSAFRQCLITSLKQRKLDLNQNKISTQIYGIRGYGSALFTLRGPYPIPILYLFD